MKLSDPRASASAIWRLPTAAIAWRKPPQANAHAHVNSSRLKLPVDKASIYMRRADTYALNFEWFRKSSFLDQNPPKALPWQPASHRPLVNNMEPGQPSRQVRSPPYELGGVVGQRPLVNDIGLRQSS